MTSTEKRELPTSIIGAASRPIHRANDCLRRCRKSAVSTLEGYPNLYRRDDILAVLRDGTAVPAMVYVMNRLPPRATVIASGDWRNR